MARPRNTVLAGGSTDVLADTLVAGLLLPYLNQAAGMVQDGYATAEDVDTAMRLGCGLPAGPLELTRRIGAGVVRDRLAQLHARTGDARHEPAAVWGEWVATGLPASIPSPDPEPGSAGVAAAAARAVSRIGVVGSGTMAAGITQVFAQAGFEVLHLARSEARVEAVRAAMEASLARAVGKGRLTDADSAATLSRLAGTTAATDLAGVDLVLEAVVEDMAVKRDLFTTLDRVCRPGAILATTTSCLPVTALGAVTSRPEDVVGLHFFNPAAVMRLVEVVRTGCTAPAVLATVTGLTARVGRHPVACGDRAGFIVNALLFPYLNDAVALAAGGASTEAVDTAVTAALGYPIGPFALIDVVGVDVTLAIQQTLHRAFGQAGLAPSPMLSSLVDSGALGRKTGRGFYFY